MFQTPLHSPSMTETETTTGHTCQDCAACAAIPRPPELDMEKEISKLHDENFLDYHPVTGNVSPLDYGRIARKLARKAQASARSSGVARDKAWGQAMIMKEEWQVDGPPNPPLFLPYTFLESVLYISGGAMMTQLRRNACGGYKGQFVYYGQALAAFNHRWEILTKKTYKGRPPTLPLLRKEEWPWKTTPIGIDPDDIMPAGWDYNSILPVGITGLPKWPNNPPKLSKDWDGRQGEPGVLRSHVKAIADHLATPHGAREYTRMLSSSATWGADRWVADIITAECLRKPYKPFPKPDAEEARIALTEGRVTW